MLSRRAPMRAVDLARCAEVIVTNGKDECAGRPVIGAGQSLEAVQFSLETFGHGKLVLRQIDNVGA